METFNDLQIREIFHLEFLRQFGRKIKQGHYALKGGANLRFFFRSVRYSEDMDIDVQEVSVHVLKETVLKILQAPSLATVLRSFEVTRIAPPDITKAKQTETTQRFKVHLITVDGTDLFTKIEFSRRGFTGEAVTEPVSDEILRAYGMPPLYVPHYGAGFAVAQKIGALAYRKEIQARDVFDIYALSSQCAPLSVPRPGKNILLKARENLFEVTFAQFRDTVTAYLSEHDRRAYGIPAAWDEVKLKAAGFLDEIGEKHAKHTGSGGA